MRIEKLSTAVVVAMADRAFTNTVKADLFNNDALEVTYRKGVLTHVYGRPIVEVVTVINRCGNQAIQGMCKLENSK